MSIIKDKSLIINELKKHYGFKKDTDFANFLGIKPTTLSSWVARNSFDYELLYSKCVGINGDWLFTGEGQMFKNEKEDKLQSEVPPKPNAEFGIIMTRYEQLIAENTLLKKQIEQQSKSIKQLNPANT